MTQYSRSLTPVCCRRKLPTRVMLCPLITVSCARRSQKPNLTVARSLTAKCSKLANLVRQSAPFRSAYESALGSGKIVSSSNQTLWNSTLRQLQCIGNLDQPTLNALLRDTNHENLILSGKDTSMLKELVQILTLLAEATDLTQGEQMVTISCVVPILLSLNNLLESYMQNTSVYTSFLCGLLASLHGRFSTLYSFLGLTPLTSSTSSKSTSFSSTSNCNLFLMAAAMDPTCLPHQHADRTTENCLSTNVHMRRFDKLRGLFSRLLCTPATSAPVERVFCQSGLLMRPHRHRCLTCLLYTSDAADE